MLTTPPSNPESIDPETLENLRDTGETFENQQQYELAMEQYHQYLLMDPSNPWVYAHLGECLRLSGELQAALEAFGKAIRLDAFYSWALTSRGELYLQLGEKALALLDLQRAVQITPDDIHLLNQTGQCLCNLLRFEEALPYFNQSVGLDPSSAWALAHRALALVETDRLADALLDINKSIEIDPRIPWAFYVRGRYFIAQGNFTEAITAFDQALEILPDFPEVLQERGLLCMDLGDYEQALLDFELLIDLNKTNGWAYACYATALAKMASKSAALQSYRKAIRLGVRDTQVFTETGLLVLETGKPEKAVDLFSKALRLDPENLNARANRAVAYLQLGDNSKALLDLTYAILHSPVADAWLYAMRAKVYSALCMTAQSLQDYNTAIKLNPD